MKTKITWRSRATLFTTSGISGGYLTAGWFLQLARLSCKERMRSAQRHLKSLHSHSWLVRLLEILLEGAA